MTQQLPAKDQATFRSIVKFYEQKQYKKGIKAADSILKKYPEHGETLCMKGLTLSYLEKKEEAYELVRKGLKFDLKSHVCWHVYGLLYRQDRDYFEAVKCYRNALRIDPSNLQILRDLSLLQIHSRDTQGFAETRRKLLQEKPGNRLNWIGYAISEHLCQSYEFAWTCIENYEKTFKDVLNNNGKDEKVSPYEISELYMYKATIMEEAGKYEEALDCLTQHERQIVDKLGLMETKARINMFLKRHEEASSLYERLIKLNPEHHVYILACMANKAQFQRFWPPLPAPADSEALLPETISSFPSSLHPLGMPIHGWLPPQQSMKPQRRVTIGQRLHKKQLSSYEPLVPLTEEEEEQVAGFFDGLAGQHKSSDSVARLAHYFVTGRRFQQRLDKYLRSRLRKGVPQLFRMIQALYHQPGKAALIEELLLQYIRCLKEHIAWFGPTVGATPGSAEAMPPSMQEEESPSCLLFTLMVTAEHYDFLGMTDKAVEHINAAIAHTPTNVEIYACKARIYRHAGDLAVSQRLYEEVRMMDLADRFLNCQSVRAMLRVDKTQEGMEKALLFSKEPDSTEATNLRDMQCMWYESAVGRSYCRQKRYGRALKEYHETFKHFNDISEDQFDFHNYCLRKATLKAYVAMLRMQEKLFSHKFYRRAAKDSIRIYLELFDDRLRQSASAGNQGSKEAEAELSPEEKKKLKHKQQREAKKAAEKKAPPAAAAPGAKPKKVDDDPEGEKLLEKEPLEEAQKLVKNLVLYCTSDPASHALSYEVFARQKKLLHCLQALHRLWQLGGQNPLHYKLVAPLAHFCFVALEALDAPHESGPPAVVREVILADVAPLLVLPGGNVDGAGAFGSLAELRATASKLVDVVEQRLKDDAGLHLIEAFYFLKCLKHAGRDCVTFLEQWQPKATFALKECRKILAYFASEYGKESKIYERFNSRCLEVFPLMR